MAHELTAQDQAEQILAGRSESASVVLDLVKRLHRERRFGLARKLLERLSRYSEVTADPELRVAVGQKLALSTYKDPDLPTDAKLERALEILRGIDDLARTENQETLGLAGAINKRMWEYDSGERHLENACSFYLRGYQYGVASDFGYTAINAAFVLDLLADLDLPDDPSRGIEGSAAAERNRRAKEIRRAIVDQLPGLPEKPGNAWLNATWWFLVTVGEAYFGLRDFDRADVWLKRAAALPEIADWERESTARQLAALMNLMARESARTGGRPDPRAQQVLRNFLGGAEAALASVVKGRIGLSLSGGGFRASLYHVGVLARLAELDLLRSVEYLSCVSGGSIIGAHYYLEVRKLLQSKTDQEITSNDYIEIVERLSRDLLSGVQRNIRVRIAAEWLTNLKVIFVPDYSRTKRAGELYEQEIFSRVQDGEADNPRFLDALKILPRGEPDDFRPKDHNWRRAAKVPILILNATSLNTGHNWQFTASWMGEPPAGIDSEVDANFRLRRMYYEQAPSPHRKMRLGYAVAASACVPGIFEPLSIADLYERLPPEGDRKVRPIVRLVDGGVHDNQGTAALLEQGCSVLLVSDASGQMDHEDAPSSGLLGVPLRANSILQSRVRVSQYQDLESRRRGSTLKGFMFVHLKKDLESQPVDWIGCQDPSESTPIRALTGYGIQRGIQRRLAAMRTDLDSFTDVEAYALMTSAYLATEASLKKPILGFNVDDAPRAPWKFLRIAPLLEQSTALSPLAQWLDRQLGVGNKVAFKVWLLMWRLQFLAGLAVAGILLGFGYALVEFSTRFLTFSISLGDILWSCVTALAALCGIGLLGKLLSYRKTLREILLGVGMATVGFLFARLHLHVFDPLFLRQGRLPLVLDQTQSAALQERSRMVQERQKVLTTARADDRKVSYAVQQSEGFLRSAKRNLDAVTESKVTQAIFQLSDNPHPDDSQRDAETSLHLLQVQGTPWRIAYDVDETLQRIRIHHLARAEDSGSKQK